MGPAILESVPQRQTSWQSESDTKCKVTPQNASHKKSKKEESFPKCPNRYSALGTMCSQTTFWYLKSYDEIEFFFACDLPSDSHGKHDTFCCHPDFHSYPWEHHSWHNWIMVSWETTSGHCYDHTAKLLLWARLCDSISHEMELVCAAHSLRSAQPKKDSFLPFLLETVLIDTSMLFQHQWFHPWPTSFQQ